ncbi:MAG: hypothetical protein IPM76_19845 [Chloroflexi bacterium]|nr:hypothetical protein [Chloroflexota bacterium]
MKKQSNGGAHCYLPNVIEELLLDAPHWWIVAGGTGSGKSVALTAVARREAGQSFVTPYSPHRWPGSAQAWLRDEPNHLAQMMASVSIEMRRFLSQRPEQLAKLTKLQREYVRWLLERAGGERTYPRWLHSLPPDVAEAYASVPQEDLFSSSDDPLDVDGQIDELICLVQAFGLQRVLFTVDLNSQESLQYQEQAANLFGWLGLMRHPGFVVMAAIPTPVLERGDILKRARGRVHVQQLKWSEAQCQEIAARHMQTAVGDTAITLQDFVDADVLRQMTAVIQQEYGQSVPGGWVALAETLLYLSQQPEAYTNRTKIDAVKRQFYGRHFPLSLDLDAHGVWRGPNFMRLDDQPLSFLDLLYRRRGHPANWDDDDLRLLAGSKNNVHSIASRTRKSNRADF